MNRVIKFRIWDYENQEMIEWDQIKNKGFHASMMVQWDGLCQFTGLKDKNGKDIYEGDIIGSHASEKPCNYIVKWGETRSDYCGFVLNPVFVNPPKFTHIIHNFKMWMTEDFEVLGNIFESPELLT